MTVEMVKVKLKKRLVCDGAFRMADYEGTMDANRANYLAGLGEVEILGDAAKKRGRPKKESEPSTETGDQSETGAGEVG